MLVKRMSEIAFEELKSCRMRLGTVYQRRKTEDVGRRDRNEGPASVHVPGADESGPRVVTAEEFNRLAGSVGAPYQFGDKLKLNMSERESQSSNHR